MRKSTYLLSLVALLAPFAAEAAAASAAPTPNCSSATPPKGDFKTFIDTCRAQANGKAKSGLDGATGTMAALDTASVYDSRTTIAGLNISSAPTWSDYDISNLFASIRDKRYMTTPDHPGFQRRISWMYPDDGCFSRAEEFDKQAYLAGKARPYKLFAFGSYPSLTVYTDNNPYGYVQWWYHVVAAVKNTAGELIVFDPAISPCRPLPWKEWLTTMQSDLSQYDNLSAGNGVALADSNAYTPFSPITGGPALQNDSTSTSDQTGYYLPSEWYRQETEMTRDPNVVLGSTPPWSGYSCLSIRPLQASSNVAAGATGTVTASCPYATLAVGGGYYLGSTSFAISKDAMSGNGWQVVAKNTGSSTQSLTTNVHCLIGAPYGASIASIQGNVVNVGGNSYASSSATCSTGKLISGGYTTTAGSPVLRVYNNARTTSTGNTWQVSGQNTTTSSKSLTSFAYCLQGTSFSVAQRTSQGADSSGYAIAGCSPGTEVLTGGGWVFPRTTNYIPQITQTMKNTTYVVSFAPPPAGGDANAKSQAECLVHP